MGSYPVQPPLFSPVQRLLTPVEYGSVRVISPVTAGDHDISKPSGHEVYRTVDDFVVHPEFDMESMIHDIAVIFLDEPLSLGQATMIVAVQLPMSEITY
ncbi:unnamed protein product, partial [Cyprideis torosa]